MATVNKDFKIKSGLIVEGTTATVNGYDVLTKKQADQDYIIGLIGGTATPDNTPDTVVKRDGTGSFAAGTVTANAINLGTTGLVSDDGGDGLLLEAINGNDVQITADDVRVTAVDDFRVSVGGDILLATSGVGTNAYVGSIDPGNEIVVEATLDAHIGDATVDGTAGNTVYDRIFNAKAEAIADAGTATDTKLADYTTTANLDTTVDGYGYLKSADLTGYATETYADNAAAGALSDAEDYADAKISDANGTATDKAWSAYKTSTEIGLAQAAAETHADEAVAALVDSAPAMLDTLNELAAALQDNPDVITDLQNVAAGKQDTLTAGSNIDITGATISVTGLDTDDVFEGTNLYFTNQRALDATALAYDISGAAATALQDAKDYADALDTDDVSEGTSNLYFTNQRAIDAVGGTIGDQIDLLTTDDIEEGETNLYFEDSRAKASAGDLLAGAETENVVITYTGGVLSITAENGVADSTTSDLAEGSNLYFTDARALDAISGSNIQPESIDITWVRRENATWTDVPTASQVVCHQAGASEGSMKYLIRVTASVGGTRHSHVTEVLATVDGSNGVAVVEYGTIYTSENPLATATVLWNGLTNCYELNVTTANNNSEVMVAATMLAVLD